VIIDGEQLIWLANFHLVVGLSVVDFETSPLEFKQQKLLNLESHRVDSHVSDPGAPQSVVDIDEFVENNDHSWPALPIPAMFQAANALLSALLAAIAHSAAGEQLSTFPGGHQATALDGGAGGDPANGGAVPPGDRHGTPRQTQEP